jgi:hypothetical protein
MRTGFPLPTVRESVRVATILLTDAAILDIGLPIRPRRLMQTKLSPL